MFILELRTSWSAWALVSVFNDNPRSSARSKFKGLRCAAASADVLSGGGAQTSLPIQGLRFHRTVFLPEFGNPQPAARVSAGKRSCGELVAKAATPSSSLRRFVRPWRTDRCCFIHIYLLAYSPSPPLWQRTAGTISTRSVRNHGAKRNLLDSGVILEEALKEWMGKGCRGINPAYDAGAALPLS